MPQLNIYVPQAMARALRQRARREKRSLSALVVGLLDERTAQTGWPEGFFESIVGQWHGSMPRITRRAAEERDLL